MKAFEVYLKIHPSIHYASAPLIKSKAFKNCTYLSPLKKSQPKSKPSCSKNSIHHELEQELPHSDQISFEEAYSQVKHRLSLIEDPLWKSVCTEMAEMMGPSAVLKIWDSRLGSFSHQHKTMALYCQTEEIAEFTRQYSFVILGSLQRYFPMIKDLKITVNQAL